MRLFVLSKVGDGLLGVRGGWFLLFICFGQGVLIAVIQFLKMLGFGLSDDKFSSIRTHILVIILTHLT